MANRLKKLIKNVTPPIILTGAKVLLRSKRERGMFGEEVREKGPDWYDKSFEANEHWKSHYSQSSYYFLWTVIADRIVRAETDSLLEVGCGSGQLACLMRDRGIRKYHGFDFSPKRVEQAKKSCPEFTFTVEDAFQTELFETCNYDAVICTEFLEHVEEDTAILHRIKSGTRFYGTVPNFPFVSHVRHFTNENEVRSRYTQYFNDFRVDLLLADAKGAIFYLIEGEKK
ncbi:MAG: class I SAM-dependent methyltransferase [Candidatus Binatia bacterium]